MGCLQNLFPPVQRSGMSDETEKSVFGRKPLESGRLQPEIFNLFTTIFYHSESGDPGPDPAATLGMTTKGRDLYPGKERRAPCESLVVRAKARAKASTVNGKTEWNDPSHKPVRDDKAKARAKA